MPTFIELRADYPLILTLLEHAFPCALTWFYIAGFTSARTIPFPMIRQNRPVPVSLYTGPSANVCSSACAPSASESTWRLTPAHASLRKRQSHVNEQLILPADTTAQLCVAAVNSISAGQQLLCWLNQQSLRLSQSHAVARLSQAESEERSVLGLAGTRLRACSRTLGANQVKLRRKTSCLKAEEP
jgi:hypothetical protein